MSDWTAGQLDRLGAADQLEITTRRPDGSLRAWVPIWVVRVGDDLYARSYRGAGGSWYRHATRTGAAHIRAAGVERDVDVKAPTDEVVHAAIDAAYRRKYGRYGGSYVTQMVSAAATAATVRLTPA